MAVLGWGTVRTMLDRLHRYANGYVAIPTLLSLRRAGVLASLSISPQTPASLVEEFEANAGYLAATLELLASLKIVKARGGSYVIDPESPAFDVPSELAAPYRATFPAWRRTHEAAKLVKLLEPMVIAPAPLPWPDWMDGALLVPLLIEGHQDADALLADLPVEFTKWLTSRGLLAAGGWTPLARTLLNKALVNGVLASYRPLLARLDALLFDPTPAPAASPTPGEEWQVDRTLNVRASGYQHAKFFKDFTSLVEDALSATSSISPFTHIADMGCGDGALLKQLFTVVGDRDKARPWCLIGADLNAKALAEAQVTLAGLPHLLMPGDVGDPAGFRRDLQARGIDPERMLHVRSFLDHDRPYRRPVQSDRRWFDGLNLAHLGIRDDGELIPPVEGMLSLVEHLERWAEQLGPAGLCLLETHQVDRRFLEEDPETTNAIHFDAIQALSRQQLVRADAFLLAAAAAGLVPTGKSLRYPTTTPYCHISGHRLVRRPFRIRPAIPADLAALSELDRRSWPEPLWTPERELQARLERCGDGHLVVEQGEEILAALYTQRLADPSQLRRCPYTEIGKLFSPDGEWVQLISLSVDPRPQAQGLGDALLDFALTLNRFRPGVVGLVGVTRCTAFTGQSRSELDNHVAARNADGRRVDPVLRFHEEHGARIGEVVPDYRPADGKNLGCGVWLEYPLQPHAARETSITAPSGRTSNDCLAIVQEVLSQVLQGEKVAADAALMDAGLDSLQLQEVRLLLSNRFGRSLDSAFLFNHPTPAAIAAALAMPAAAASAAISLRKDSAMPTASPTATSLAPTDIAIIGLGCRFPGNVADPEAFWRLLANGGNAVREVPPERWSNLYHPDPDQPGSMWSRTGGFLTGIDQFDAPFFNITPREAMSLDPQQRWLLETAWHALEHAGISPASLRGTATGVFIGQSSSDYERLVFADRNGIDAYSATGTFASTMPGRISYLLDLRGPSVAVDTACSSSLVAVHLACQSLLAGESSLALAAGVNILFPEYSICFTKARMLSPDGLCCTFDAGANGYVRGEGCGVVVLKRAVEAQRDGDRILALIRATGSNQDGHSNGLTAPNGQAQEALLREILRRGGVQPSQVSYVEAHGTATPLGDPIEVGALTAVLGEGRPADLSLALASVKTNIGHLEAASGIAALIKTTLALQHHQLPASLNFETLNPRIETHGVDLQIPRQLRPWPPIHERRIAVVSSFGFGGTNAQALLKEAPPPPSALGVERPRQILPLSAKNEDALRELAQNYDSFLAGYQGSLQDLARTAAEGRGHFAHRLAVVGKSAADLRQQLAAAFDTSPAPLEIGPAGIAFLFTGQGAQFPAMGQELYETQPTFRRVLEECNEQLRPHLPQPLLTVLFPSDADRDKIHQTQYTQPALFALEYALAVLWRSWGIEPSLLLGHSIGEYVAACLAGVLRLPDALRLVARRGALIQSLPAGGKMAAVFAPVEKVEPWFVPDAAQVSIAAINGPAETVVSGAGTAVETLVETLRANGMAAQLLTVSHAFHSPLLEPILAEFHQEASQVHYATPRIPVLSNVTGQLYDAHQPVDADYWTRHLREGVRFAPALRTAQELGVRTFLEVGPQPILGNLGRRCLAGVPALWLASLRRGASDWQTLLETLATLYRAGAAVDWTGFGRDYPGNKVTAPLYPFQCRRYWVDQRPNLGKTAATSATPAPTAATERHVLLGSPLHLPRGGRHFQKQLTAEAPLAWADHRIGGRCLFPATGYLEMALALGRELYTSGFQLLDFAIEAPLPLEENAPPLFHTVAETDTAESGHRIAIYAANNTETGTWIKLAEGRLVPDAAVGSAPDPIDLSTLGSAGDFYDRLKARGYEYGPQFRTVRRLAASADQLLAEVALAQGTPDGFLVPPTLADGCLQAVLGLPGLAQELLYLPVGWGSFSWQPGRGSPTRLGVRVRPHSVADPARITADLDLFDETGDLQTTWRGVRFHGVRQMGPPTEAPPARAPVGPATADTAEAVVELERRLVHRLRQIMALPDDVPLKVETPFSELGLDSLMATDLHFEAEKAAGKKLPETLLRDHANLKRLAHFLATQKRRAGA